MRESLRVGFRSSGLSRRSFLRAAGMGALAGVGVPALAACGGDDGSDGAGGKGAVAAGHVPSDHMAPLYVAVANGYFRDNGLDVKLNDFTSGATLVESFSAGQLDIGYLGPPSRTAVARGIPVQIVAGCQQEGSAVVVRDDAIRSVADLRGRRVGIPARGTVAHLLVMKGLIDQGGNPEDVSFLEVGDPAGVELSLRNGEVDAAAWWEPYIAVMKSGGARVLATSADIWPGHQDVVLAATTSLIRDRREVAEAVVDSHMRGIEFIVGNVDEAARIVAAQLGTDPALEREALAGQTFTSEMSEVRIMEEYDLLGRLGIVKPADVPAWGRLVNEELYTRALG